MKSAEHQINGCPTQIFLTLTIAFYLQPHTHRLQDALRVRDTNPGELAARGLQGKDFRVPGSLLAVTTRTLISNCNTPIITNRFSGTRLTSTRQDQQCADVSECEMFHSWYFTAFSHCRKDGDAWDQPWHSAPSFLKPFGIPSYSSLPRGFLGAPAGGDNSFKEFGFVPLDCTGKLNCKLPLEFPFLIFFYKKSIKIFQEKYNAKNKTFTCMSQHHSKII